MDVKTEVQKFIISYLKLYAKEMNFLGEVARANLDSAHSLVQDLKSLETLMLSVIDSNFDKELVDTTEEAHFVVTIDDNDK